MSDDARRLAPAISSLCRGRSSSWVLATALLVTASLLASGQQPQQAPSFKAGVTSVPLNVQILDRNGKPVSDLRREDFTITEEGVPQRVTVFERYTLAPIATPPTTMLVPDRAVASRVVADQRRVFLLMLGPRVWLTEEPFGTTAAVTAFIRKRLLPQDYVAVSAWGRVTKVTTDHERVASVVERLQMWQASIDEKGQGARAAVIRGILRGELDADLDRVFGTARRLPYGESARTSNLLDQVASHVETLDRAGSAGQVFGPSLIDHLSGQLLDVFGGIRYLQFVEGEKRLVYISNDGFSLPAVDDDVGLAQIASDARVAIDVVQTGGLARFDEFGRPGAQVSLFASMSAKHLSELTGGRASHYHYPEEGLNGVDLVTKSGYLLAYSPTNSTLDGRYRKIAIAVNRPKGATVLFRHGYLARAEALPYDDRRFVIQDRIMSVAAIASPVVEITVSLTTSKKEGEVVAEAVIDVSRLALKEVDGRHVGSLDIGFFCSDERERLVGELWQTVNLNLGQPSYRRVVEEGLHHRGVVKPNGVARYVKVVVYEYASGRSGSAVARVGGDSSAK